MKLYGYEFFRESDLKHYGLKGMKWGTRRWQNYDSTNSFNEAGIRRYFDRSPGEHTESAKLGKGPFTNKSKMAKKPSKVGSKNNQSSEPKAHSSTNKGHVSEKGNKKSITSNKDNKPLKGAILFDGKTGDDINKEILKANPNAAVAVKDPSWFSAHKKQVLIGVGVVAGTALVAAGTAYVLKNKNILKSPLKNVDKTPDKTVQNFVKNNAANPVNVANAANPVNAANATAKDKYGGFNSNEERFIYGWLKANFVDKRHVISESEFLKMTNDDAVTLNAGHKMFRMSKSNHSTLRNGIEYVSISEDDRKRYRAFLPAMWKSRGFRGTEVFEAELSAATKIKTPGKKETVEIMEAIMQKMYGHQYSKEVIHNDVLAHFCQYSGSLANRDSAFAEEFFKELTSRGFNAVIDYNDAGNLSDKPLILINGARSAKVEQVTTHLVQDLRKELSNIKAVEAYTDFSMADWAKAADELTRRKFENQVLLKWL